MQLYPTTQSISTKTADPQFLPNQTPEEVPITATSAEDVSISHNDDITVRDCVQDDVVEPTPAITENVAEKPVLVDSAAIITTMEPKAYVDHVKVQPDMKKPLLPTPLIVPPVIAQQQVTSGLAERC